MNLEIKKLVIFTDIDGVLTTTTQYLTNEKNWNPEYHRYRFDDKCVKVFNKVIDACNPLIVISSDWRDDYTIDAFNRIFEINGVHAKVFDYTPSLWGTKFNNYSELEICRATEILEYVDVYKIQNYIAIDDLNLSHWLGDNFIHTPRANEGIKQSGVLDKILNKLNQLI